MSRCAICHVLRRKSPGVALLLFLTFLITLCQPAPGISGGWPDLTVRLLSSAAFAVLEIDKNGNKIRHCPHHDQNGRIDEEQLIYVLGTLDQETWLDPKCKIEAQKHLEKHYDRVRTKILKRGLRKSVSINRASLIELVALPQIGPVLAVKIVEYRNTHNLYITIDDIKKVDGIGLGIFNAIRHYISTD